MFSESSNSCCFFGNESLTVNLSISGVEASNRLSVEVLSISNVVRIRGYGLYLSLSIVI